MFLGDILSNTSFVFFCLWEILWKALLFMFKICQYFNSWKEENNIIKTYILVVKDDILIQHNLCKLPWRQNKLFGSVYSGFYKVNGNICTSSKQNNIDYTNLYTLWYSVFRSMKNHLCDMWVWFRSLNAVDHGFNPQLVQKPKTA